MFHHTGYTRSTPGTPGTRIARLALYPWRPIAVAIIGVAAACPSTRGGTSAGILAEADWRLVELNGQPAVPTDAARRPWLRFAADSGRVSGSGGCNRASGPFTVDGSSIHFGPIISTKMACADAALNQQETGFFSVLQSTDRYEVVSDTLSLYHGPNRLARLVR